MSNDHAPHEPSNAAARPRGRSKTLITAFVVWAIAVAGLIFGVRLRGRIADARSWPTTRGHVVAREVEGPNFKTGTSFTPVVKYEYDVAGKHYVNDQYYSEKFQSGDLHRMERIVRDTPDTVEVHYNAADPSRSFLELGSIGLAWAAIGFSLFLGFIGLVFFVQ